jgi:hypothetical protein
MTMYFHGTDDDRATAILADGFDMEAPRRSDPGDLGWGIYLTDRISRARAHGSSVLNVDVDESRFARIANPYFLKGLQEVMPETREERLFHGVAFKDGQMLSVKGSKEDRIATARLIRDTFLAAGFDGIIAGPDQMRQREVVVFNPEAVQSIRIKA